jgi:hypothetical protein
VLWLLGLVTRPFRRRTAAASPAPVGAPAGYPPPSPAAGGPLPATPGPAPPPGTSAARSRGCLGCLGWVVFGMDVLLLGASSAALYLWTTPLLTFPG